MKILPKERRKFVAISIDITQEILMSMIHVIKGKIAMAAQDKVIRAIILSKETAESFARTWYGLKA